MAEFQQALDDLGVAEQALRSLPDTFEAMEMESALDAALLKAYREIKPKAQYTRDKAIKVLDMERFSEIRAHFVEEASVLYAKYKAPVTELKERVGALALGYPLESDDEWRELKGYTDYTWASAGPQYGRGHAQIDVEALEQLGLEAEITCEGSSWIVRVKATELTIEALKRRDLQTVREFLKSCWSRALNPRVYSPFLPHGLEQKLGVTWQGRDMEGWKGG